MRAGSILVLALLSTAAAAQTTVQPLLRASEDTLGNAITYPDMAASGTGIASEDAAVAPGAVPAPADGAAEITGAIVTMLPGDSTGWHRHPVPTFSYLLSGEVTVEYATGESRTFRAGDAVIEAQTVAHNGHTRGDEPVTILVVSAGAQGVPTSEPADPPVPDDFVDLADAVPGIAVSLRYAGNDNFIGRPIRGYEANRAYLTDDAATALSAAQRLLAAKGLGLKVFDAYRPQRAVDDFVRWAADPADTSMKPAYYPDVDKTELLPSGYIAERSGHSRGSTVDLTLIDLATGAELDMGSPYDYFDPISWPSSRDVPESARANRMLLRETMSGQGFAPLEQEWWHFTLREEPFPETYFDFPVR